jgi:hypothetical protein
VTLVVKRSRTGTVDRAYGEGGRFLAEQTRSVSFVSGE